MRSNKSDLISCVRAGGVSGSGESGGREVAVRVIEFSEMTLNGQWAVSVRHSSRDCGFVCS